MDTLRIALVGTGMRAQHGWLQCLQLAERCELVAVCDRNEPVLARAAEMAGLPSDRAHLDLDELLARDDVDAVAVVVAPEYQAAIALRAIATGRHVLCEVPLTYSLEDCWRLVVEAERADITIAMAEQLSHSAFATEWRRLVEEGRLGSILYGEAQYLHGVDQQRWADRETGTYLTWEEAETHPRAVKTRMWNLHHPIWYNPHSLTPLLRVLDRRVTRVTCMATPRPSLYRPEIPDPDVETALMETDAGTVIRITTGFISPMAYPAHWLHLLGTAGEVETGRGVEIDGEGFSWFAPGGEQYRQPTRWRLIEETASDRVKASGHGGIDLLPIQDFVDSVLDGHPPLIDVYRAANVAAAGILAGASADQAAEPIDVPDFRPGRQRARGAFPAGFLVVAGDG
jgi:predicted dehydrogenase